MEGYQLARPSHRRPWSGDDDRQLNDLIGRGALIGEVASELGRTREAVRNRANLLGLSIQSSPGRGRRRLGPGA